MQWHEDPSTWLVSGSELGLLVPPAAVVTTTETEEFTEFVERYQPMLKNALVAAVGPDLAADAVAEALEYCWLSWDRIRAMENPAGYVWTVGRSKGRDLMRKRRRDRDHTSLWPQVPSGSEPVVEPALPAAFSRLTERQRLAVFLIHGYGWTHREVAEFLGLSVPTIQKHAERGLAKLQRAMGVTR